MTTMQQTAMNLAPKAIPHLPEDKVKQVISIFMTVPAEEEQTVYKKRTYVPSSAYSEANRAERMERFMQSAGKIDVDEEAIKELREVSIV